MPPLIIHSRQSMPLPKSPHRAAEAERQRRCAFGVRRGSRSNKQASGSASDSDSSIDCWGKKMGQIMSHVLDVLWGKEDRCVLVLALGMAGGSLGRSIEGLLGGVLCVIAVVGVGVVTAAGLALHRSSFDGVETRGPRPFVLPLPRPRSPRHITPSTNPLDTTGEY